MTRGGDYGHYPKFILQKVRNYFPTYKFNPEKGAIISTQERLTWPATILISLQHVLSFIGATVIGPSLMGFSANTSLFFSGIGTLIFYICTGGKIPSYVGSSFAFIGVVNAATGYHFAPGTMNQNIPVALGGILVCGFIYLAISIIVMFAGVGWIEVLTPPIVTGTVVMAIGLNLAGSAINQAASSGFDAWIAFATVVMTCLFICYAPGVLSRLPILLGGLFGYFLYLFLGLAGVGPGIDFKGVGESKWFGAPPLHLPVFEGSAISLIAPIAIILVAENIGHVKAVGSMTNQKLDHLLGRAFLGDSIATIVAGSFGGLGTTTYAENIGVMSITKIYSTLPFVICGFIAIFLGLFAKFGAVLQSIPSGVFGALSIILFGMIAITGARIWIEDQVDFKKPRNLLTAGIGIVIGSGMTNGIVVSWGVIKLDGIGVSTLGSIILYQLLREDWKQIFHYLYSRARGRKSNYPTRKGGYSDCNDNNSKKHEDHSTTTIEMPSISSTEDRSLTSSSSSSSSDPPQQQQLLLQTPTRLNDDSINDNV
ncbi:xanthine/uracil permease family protein [Cavenderia fasciculata]|uniref:Xanthine/uracil permease family protein n=1 Tax=Cavenderia fasciculata TaxID=261658 RepID=F4PT26_CACFS|nr:xanthine/uracil permease family protein [Cavenderia fasciculata]EGG21602.1 xanthine/uracil permease family protein [Cavenderia fasciculata]|eukprot:XP_004359452.1 xanthine/uracil permease family protein [Cavenderia fasciculata]